MNYYTIILNGNLNGVNGSDLPVSPFRLKGETEVEMDLTNIGDGEYEIVKIEIDYGDYKHPVDKVVDVFSISNSFLTSGKKYTHVYNPIFDDNNYGRYYPSVSITFSNFNKFEYKFDLMIYKDSFYSRHGKLTINSAQFIDNADDSMFLVLNNINRDKFNMSIK